ncbi:hypothetical protein GCM10010174_47960 [Kutzneria viridogrisea]|uniref:Uncharacterized protein n=2 Tax=Kutzneria TaxID=43356 RepID=W5WCN3_9PSEU|nr:hypothetical protein [Kutzneria albida]AHH98918.1 hypothetical protein KALB_5556 [Kutzneria albida DSM 43870]MBA8923527.1 hypothetical protein [Kutzneria viridogrisea]
MLRCTVLANRAFKVSKQYLADINHCLGFATVRRHSVVDRELDGLRL